MIKDSNARQLVFLGCEELRLQNTIITGVAALQGVP